MEYRKLGDSDLSVSAVCLGTMTFGQQNSEADAHAQLDRAVEAGINFIDTAEMYPVPPRAETCGATESMVGSWLRRQRRDAVILATKVAGPARATAWIRGGPKALDADNIRTAIDGSLRRLQTDYVDLYQLHWPERYTPMFGQYNYDVSKERDSVPIEDQLWALQELIRAGKVRYVGLSNETPWGLCEFVRVAEALGLPRVVSVQNAYSLLNRTYEFGMSEAGQRLNVPLLPYSPLAMGHLTGKYLENPNAPGRLTLFDGFGQRYAKENVLPASRAYAELARANGLTPTRLALGFVASRWFVASTIIGATTIPQLDENIAACAEPLPDEVLKAIEAIHLRYFNPAP